MTTNLAFAWLDHARNRLAELELLHLDPQIARRAADALSLIERGDLPKPTVEVHLWLCIVFDRDHRRITLSFRDQEMHWWRIEGKLPGAIEVRENWCVPGATLLRELADWLMGDGECAGR